MRLKEFLLLPQLMIKKNVISQKKTQIIQREIRKKCTHDNSENDVITF